MLVFSTLGAANGTALSSVDPNWAAVSSLVIIDGALQDTGHYTTGKAMYQLPGGNHIGVVFEKDRIVNNYNHIYMNAAGGDEKTGYQFEVVAPRPPDVPYEYIGVKVLSKNSFLTEFRVNGSDFAKFSPYVFDLKVKVERSAAAGGAMIRCYLAPGVNAPYEEINLNGGGKGFLDPNPPPDGGFVGFKIGNTSYAPPSKDHTTRILAIDADVFASAASAAPLSDQTFSKGIARGLQRGIV